MNQELNNILTNLEDAGCGEDAREKVMQIYNNGNSSELLRYLRCCRCGLVEQMHESQRKVDRMDYLIRKVERQYHAQN